MDKQELRFELLCTIRSGNCFKINFHRIQMFLMKLSILFFYSQCELSFSRIKKLWWNNNIMLRNDKKYFSTLISHKIVSSSLLHRLHSRLHNYTTTKTIMAQHPNTMNVLGLNFIHPSYKFIFHDYYSCVFRIFYLSNSIVNLHLKVSLRT